MEVLWKNMKNDIHLFDDSLTFIIDQEELDKLRPKSLSGEDNADN